MENPLGKIIDIALHVLRIRHPALRLKPLKPVTWQASRAQTIKQPSKEDLAVRLHSLRPEVSIDDFRKQVQNPIASRGIAIWVKVLLPQLGREMIMDTRVDNPEGLPLSLRKLPASGPGSPWPAAPVPVVRPHSHAWASEVGILGHSGSSCPGHLSRFAVFPGSEAMEIPVEVLAFHAEGDNGLCAYSVSMYSEVTGRLSAKVPGESPAVLTMWGKMLISVRPHDPGLFGGHELIQLRSRDYIEQHGEVSGFPPHTAGEYLESNGNEVYLGFHPGQRHIKAVVERGRIIFSTDIDEFLQARTRITSFTLLDRDGNPIHADGPPYDPGLIGEIAGVRLDWTDIRGEFPFVSHYRLYRMDPDQPQEFYPIGGMLTDPTYIDVDYDGRRSYAYAVIPAFVDSAGVETQGVSLDHSMIMHLQPRSEQFTHCNMGVGHVRRMK